MHFAFSWAQWKIHTHFLTTYMKLCLVYINNMNNLSGLGCKFLKKTIMHKDSFKIIYYILNHLVLLVGLCQLFLQSFYLFFCFSKNYGKLVSVLLMLLLHHLACTLVLHSFHSMIVRRGVGEVGEYEMFMSFLWYFKVCLSLLDERKQIHFYPSMIITSLQFKCIEIVGYILLLSLSRKLCSLKCQILNI